MKIKRYIAPSMRAALAQVRSDQGPEAVILSSRKVAEGLEVIAAVDYDEALFAGATGKRPSVPVPEIALPAAFDSAPAARVDVPGSIAPEIRAAIVAAMGAAAPREEAAPEVPTTFAPAIIVPVTEAGFADGDYRAVRRELQDLRELLRGELAHMSWNDKRLREPLQAQVLERLTAVDIAPDIALTLAALIPRRTGETDSARVALALLMHHLLVVDGLSPLTGGVIAIIGPTGAGKTTTIAKLAARWSLQFGSQDLALVSTDGYRVGAREQLAAYARLLGAPLHVANTGAELALLLERLKDKKHVLIDTAGMGPRDVRLQEQLAALRLGAARARILLALPAQGEAHALEQIVRSFAAIAPTACVLTKVDEAASLGAVLSTVLRHELPIAYVCDGQHVPQDMHAAHERRVWLARTAFELKELAAAPRDDAYFARNFGRAHAHA